MERLTDTKTAGLNGNALRAWGLFFCAMGIVGRGIIQEQLLGIGTVSTQQLLELLQSSRETMILATVALVLQAMETCAAPVFALLLVEGVQHTSDFMRYLLRVAGLAVLSEIFYNLAMSGSVLDFTGRNPVFGMVLGLVMLYFYQRYAQRSLQNTLIKAVVTVAAVVWAQMLQIEFGACMALLVAVVWAFRKKPLYRNMAAAVMAVVCSLLNPFFLAAPMGALLVHMYNGEKGTTSRPVNYLAYPAMLLAVGLIRIFVL